MTTTVPHKFDRFKKMVGAPALTLLSAKKVLVLGVGGVGGYVCEALVRSGIGSMVIVDGDVVEGTNLNRQIIALHSTIGRRKVDVLEERLLDINPDCKIKKIDCFITDDNIDILFQDKYDYIIDACDTITVKKRLIKECVSRNIPFISSMGTGNKLDPSKLEITDIRKTVNDPLARIIRKYVKDEKIKEKVIVLSSTELPIKNHDRTPGSTAFVPSSAGLLIASYVIRSFLRK